jgi:hypothetical protein
MPPLLVLLVLALVLLISPVSLQSSRGKLINYASRDCGARVREANREARATNKLLDKDKDSYMLTPCAARKYVVIELCEFVQVEAIALANYEFYSSTFHEIHLLGSKDSFPTKTWVLLGVFSANNTRDLQVFELPKPYWV